MNEAYVYFTAKTDPENTNKWLPLWMHCKDTAMVMKKLFEWLPMSVFEQMSITLDEARKISVFLGAVHDIGKATNKFQLNINKALPDIAERLSNYVAVKDIVLKSSVRHAGAGESILLSMGCPHGIASVVGSHHGKPFEEMSGIYSDSYIDDYALEVYSEDEKDKWRSVWEEIIKDGFNLSGFNNFDEMPELLIKDELLFTGILIMADWISSNIKFFPLIDTDVVGNLDMYPDRVERGWSKLNLPEMWEPMFNSINENNFINRFGFEPNEMQKSVMEIARDMKEPGLMIIEANMGSGKTEAALAAAEIIASKFGEGGLFFGLPTQATTNGLFLRLKKWAESQSEEVVHSIRLAHGAAELNEDYRELMTGKSVVEQDNLLGGLTVHQWFQGRKQAMLADFVFGTVDQLLLAGLKQKHVMLRHLGIVEKAIIVDECHAYDTYMNTYFDRVLEWLGSYKVPTILLSATLPKKRKEEMLKAYVRNKNLSIDFSTLRYPLITWTEAESVCFHEVRDFGAKKKVNINRISEDNIISTIKSKLVNGGCAGIVVNTVNKAQVIASEIQLALPDFEVILFHSQFVMADRRNIERTILERLGKNSTSKERNKMIVVGTQVIEQSLDIDFDFMISELCPMDLLIQRIGRLHRHQRHGKRFGIDAPECAVIVGEDDKMDDGSVAVYGKWLLWRTNRLLPSIINLPEDISHLIECVYTWGENDVLPVNSDSNLMREEFERKIKEKQQKADAFRILEPSNKKKPLDNWLINTMECGEEGARAAVRDGDPSIDVIVLVRAKDEIIHFLPWQYGGSAVESDRAPSREECLKIAQQKIKLPTFFSKKWNIDKVISELEKLNIKYLAEWQNAPLLKGELVLLLDEKLEATLLGQSLQYNRKTGLIVQIGGTVYGKN